MRTPMLLLFCALLIVAVIWTLMPRVNVTLTEDGTDVAGISLAAPSDHDGTAQAAVK